MTPAVRRGPLHAPGVPGGSQGFPGGGPRAVDSGVRVLDTGPGMPQPSLT